MSVQNQVKGVTSLVGGKGHRLVKAKVIQQRRQTDSKRIGGDINMNVDMQEAEKASSIPIILIPNLRLSKVQ